MVGLQKIFQLISPSQSPAGDPSRHETPFSCGPPVLGNVVTSQSELGQGCAPQSPDNTEDGDDVNADWKHAVRFPSEAQRMAVLQSLQVLHTEPEQRFDTITRYVFCYEHCFLAPTMQAALPTAVWLRVFCRLMASIFKTPVALVALIESDQLWFKSVAGPFGSCITRQGSLCDQILVPDSAEVLFVEDLAADARFASSPLVCGDPFVRFYAGAPLLGSAGHRYGTLCVLDIVPRVFPVSLISCLVNFSELVVRELERNAIMATDEGLLLSLGPLSRNKTSLAEPVALVDVNTDGWNVMYANASWAKELGFGADGAVSNTFWNYFHLGDAMTSENERADHIEKSMRMIQPFQMSLCLRNSDACTRAGQGCHCVVFRPATDSLATNIPVGKCFVCVDCVLCVLYP